MRVISKVIIGITTLLIILGIAFGVYTVYGEKEAVQNLEAEIYDISVSRIGLTSADISIVLRFYNPTQFDTPTFSAEYDIYLADRYFGHGSIPQTKILAYSSTLQPITVTVSYFDVAKSLIEALVRGEISISGSGTVYSKIFFDLIPISKYFIF